VIAGKADTRRLGDAQRYILESIALDSMPSDARSRRVAESLERRGYAYTNYGRWYVSERGRAALARVQA
jgi:hypothetical protein